MLREQRKSPRLRRRLQVAYGEHDLGTNGFGLDISAGGIFVTATTLLPPGTRVHMKVTMGAVVFFAEGRVVRQKLVHQALRGTDPQGMGIRFLSPQEIIEGLGPVPRKTAPAPFCVTCKTAPAMEDLIRDQLARGVIIVPTGETPPEAGANIEFRVTLEFPAEPQTVAAQGRVVQLLNQAGSAEARAAVLEVGGAVGVIERLRRAGA